MEQNRTVVTRDMINLARKIVEDTKDFIRNGNYTPEEIVLFMDERSEEIVKLPKRVQMEMSLFYVRYLVPLMKYCMEPFEDIQMSISNVEMGYGEAIDEIYEDAHDALALWYEISDNIFRGLENCYIKVGEVLENI